MANVNRPYGFRPQRYRDGSAFTGATTLYGFSASQANNAYKGDVVTFDATNRSTALTDPYAPGIPLVAPAVAGVTTTAIRGIIAGFVPQPEFNMSTSASLGFMYRAASTARYTWIVDDYNVVFEVQENANDYVSTSNNSIGQTSDLAYTAGSQVTGVSGAQISSTGFQAAAVRPFKALNYTQRIDNFNFSAADATSFAHLDVVIINSDMAQANIGA